MHTPAYKPITPQQQHTDPSRLRFVGPLRIPASGILVKWRSQCMEYMGSMESKSSIVREQSAKHKIEFKRDEVEKALPPPTPYDAVDRQTGMYQGDYEYFEGFHTEREDEATEY